MVRKEIRTKRSEEKRLLLISSFEGAKNKEKKMTEWTKRKYNEYYTSYVPWLEDKYLQWFGENKTSYTAKGEPVVSFSLFLFFFFLFLSSSSSSSSSFSVFFISIKLCNITREFKTEV